MEGAAPPRLVVVLIPVIIPENPLTVVMVLIVSSKGTVSIGTSTFGGVECVYPTPISVIFAVPDSEPLTTGIVAVAIPV